MAPGFKNIATATPLSDATDQWHPLSLDELQAHLQSGKVLPKDAFVTTDIAGLHSNSYRNRDRNYDRAVLHALTAVSSTAQEQRLALRISNCRNRHRCKRLTCFICSQRYWRERRALIEPLASSCADDEISLCTVIIGVSQIGYPILRDMISQFKANFCIALGRYPTVNWSGRVEIDYLDQSVSSVKPAKQKTLSDLRWDATDEMPSLILHVHLIVMHPGVRRETLAYHLKKRFPGSRRVQLRAFRVTRDRSDSLDSLVRYPLKPPLDRVFLASRSNKNHIPRHPAAVRYMERIREALDRPSQRWRLEFDHLWPVRRDVRHCAPKYECVPKCECAAKYWWVPKYRWVPKYECAPTYGGDG